MTSLGIHSLIGRKVFRFELKPGTFVPIYLGRSRTKKGDLFFFFKEIETSSASGENIYREDIPSVP